MRDGPRRAGTVLGSAVFLLLAPGSVAGLVPWAITGWSAGSHPLPVALRGLGAALVVGGLLSLLDSFARFVMVGQGTPAPVAPPLRLVVTGQYRYVRNPMYLAVQGIVFGQALLFASAWLLVYAAALAAVFQAWVVWYEEPRLRRQFGVAYERYRQHVRRWRPGRWRGEVGD